MNSFSAGAVMVFGTVMAIAGGMSLGSVGDPPFHYGSASPSERAEFLEKAAKPMRRALSRALISPSGVGPKLSLGETRVDPHGGKITFFIKVGGVSSLGGALAIVDQQMREKACPGYAKSELARHGIRLVHTFVTPHHAEMGRVTLSPDRCARYVG